LAAVAFFDFSSKKLLQKAGRSLKNALAIVLREKKKLIFIANYVRKNTNRK